MAILECGHAGPPGGSSLCAHLVGGALPGAGFVGLLTGEGLAYDRACHECADADTALKTACKGCLEPFDGVWPDAWRGEPGIAERLEPLDAGLVRTPLPHELGTVVDAAPVKDGWLLLTSDGRIFALDGDEPHRPLAAVKVKATPGATNWNGDEPRLRLHASPDGRFAAVVRDYDRFGKVADLTTGKVTLDLNGGSHCQETVPFSLAFTRHGLIHRTDWNRLDVSDPAGGKPLTARRTGEGAHDLDYFHGELHVSPSGRWVAEDGWVWHPVGIPVVWDLDRWLAGHPYESEDGPSRRSLCLRDYHWNEPMAWIADDLLAVSGIGDDGAAMIPGARLFDPATGAEVRAFPGPKGQFFAYAGTLYSAHEDGLHVWDPATGTRVGRIPGFVPTHLNPHTGELAALTGRHLVRLRLKP